MDAGINEVAQNTSLNIYPNPFEDNLVVKTRNSNQKIQSIEIFDCWEGEYSTKLSML